MPALPDDQISTVPARTEREPKLAADPVRYARLLLLAAVLGGIALSLPWFQPRATSARRSMSSSAYCGQGRGVIVATLLFGVAVIGHIVGRGIRVRLRRGRPLLNYSLITIASGFVLGLVALSAWNAVKIDGLSPHDLRASGYAVAPGVQPGLMVMMISSVMTIVVGVALLVRAEGSSRGSGPAD